jgi:hypothetical protein
VWVESDLLLLTSSRVHEVVRVQISSLCVVMSNADSASKSNINWDISHSLGVECCLKLGAHESVSITWVRKAEEMNSEHGHVECDRNYDEAEYSGHKVLGEKTL